MKKVFLSKKFYIILTSVFAVIAITALIFNNINKEPEPKFKSYVNAYSSGQSEITSTQATSDNSINMSDLYTASNNEITSKGVSVEGKTINIITALDLYAFSKLAEADESAFLEYNYQLLNNIDYSKCSYDFIPIAYKENAAFIGKFNGNGYEISNLTLIRLSTNEFETDYFAMFSKLGSGAVVTNFGLVNTNIIINKSFKNGQGVAPAVGLIGSGAEVSYIFAKDLRDPIEDESGITAAGGHRISGLVFENRGKMHDCYTAYNILVNYTVDDYSDFTEILTENSGNYENIFFYNSTISSFLSGTPTEYEIVYENPVDRKFNFDYYFGTYCKEISVLNTNVINTNESNTNENNLKWKNENNYPFSIQSYDTPITRGISYSVDENGKYNFSVNNEKEFCYMFELMNENAEFASDKVVYSINKDLNLEMYSPDSYYYQYGINATIQGMNLGDGNGSISLANGSKNNFPTIYNAKLSNFVITEGIDCYGVFPWVTGSISNLNFVVNSQSITSSSTNNIKAIGVAFGLCDGATIDNINVYCNGLTVSNSIGKYFVGGITGMMSGESTITNSTSAGSIEITGDGSSLQEVNGYLQGCSVGGCIGYISSTYGNVNTVLNATSITMAGPNSQLAIGGIVGAGYVADFQKLENKGSITLNSANASTYASGIIGRLLGVCNQILDLTNKGNISIAPNSSSDNYVSGILNVDIVTPSSGHNLDVSKFKFNNKFYFWASSSANYGDILITSASSKLEYTSGININSKNGFISKLSGIYNCTNSKALSIDMSFVPKYAGVLNVISNSNTQTVDISTVYNLRNISFKTTTDLSSSTSNLMYSGCVLGKNINYNDVRNEGDLIFTPNNNITCSSITTVGVLEEVSSGYSANSIFNGGDIKLDSNAIITSNLYFSGICHANRNGFNDSEMELFNPLSASFDSGQTGSLNNIINNGNITVTNSSYSEISFTYEGITSSNGQQLIGVNYVYDNIPTGHIIGNVNISGITYLNESVITNTFNLGNIYNVNYADGSYNLLSSGISVLNVSKNAYILNSANNGIIKTMNLSTNINAKVYSSGISCRNDRNENETEYNGEANHAGQIISFTINYGSIFSYNYANNISSSADEPRTNSSGILSFGLCNIINVVNYGNIYSSETSSGIFGVIYFQKFSNDVDENNTVNISNSINYANVYVLEKGENIFYDNSSYKITYNNFLNISDSNINNNDSLTIDNVPYGMKIESGNNFTILTETKTIKPIYAKLHIERAEGINFYIGSIFSLVNFNNDDNANNVKIRYLISFNENVKIVSFEAGTPSTVNCDVSKIYSSYYSFIDGNDTFSKYMGKNVTYSPLNQNDKNSIGQKNYIGVFSEEFEFRKAIEGKLELNTNSYPTDKFLTDYFQYVNYKKINPVLLDKIGWRSFAYLDAANSFAMSLEGTKLFYNYYKDYIENNNYSNDIDAALSTGTWSLYADTYILLKSVEEILAESSDANEVETVISYFFTCENNVLINNAFKSDLINYILSVDGNILNTENLLAFENGYSSILAEVLCSNNDNNLKNYIKEKIDTIIHNMNPSSKEDLLIAYNDYLLNNGNDFFLNTSNTSRYKLLYNFFDNIDSDDFYVALRSLLKPESISEIDSTVSDAIKQYDGYNRLTEDEKKSLFESILNSNDEAKINDYIDKYGSEINVYNDLGISNFNDIYTLIDSSSTNTTNANTISQRVELYNQIKNTNTFKNYISTLITAPILDVATEHNNTFQSNVAPNNNGTTTANVGYSYTNIVTPSTYFYGPYNSDGTRIYTKGYNENLVFGTTNSNGYYHMFMTTDENIYNEFYDAGKITEGTIYRYEYGTANSNNQFTILGGGLFTGNNSKYIEDFGGYYYVSDFTGCQLKYDSSITLIDSSGEVFSTAGASISPIYLDSKKTSFGSTDTTSGKYFIIDKNGKKHLISDDNAKRLDNNSSINNIASWYNLYATYGIDYYMATPTDTYNTENDYGTGILLYYDNKNWFTLKQSSTAAKTSQYIKYNTDRLLLVDGVYSTYDDKTTQCEDERNIINRLFNEYFLIEKNVNNFKQIVKKSLFETLGINSDNTANIDFINNMIISNINTSIKINNTAPLTYLTYTITVDTNTNIKTETSVTTYLESKYVANNKTNIISAASSNKSVFCDLIDVLFKQTKNIDSGTSNSQIAIDGYTPTNLESPIEFEGVTYKQYFTFTSMEFEVNSNDKALKIILSNDGGSKTLSYTFKDSENNILDSNGITKQFKDIQILTIVVPTNTKKIIINSNNDIFIYGLYTLDATQITYDANGESTYTGGYLYSEEISTGYTERIYSNLRIENDNIVYDPSATNCYTLPTESELLSLIGNSNGNDVNILSVSLSLTVKSGTDNLYYIISSVINNSGTLSFPNYYNGSKDVLAKSETDIIVINDAKNYLGNILTILGNSSSIPNNWGSGNLDKNIYFTNISMNVLYTTDIISSNPYTVTYTYEPNRSLLASVEDYSLDFISDTIKNHEKYDDFVKNLIVYLTPLDACSSDIVNNYQEGLLESNFYKLLSNYSNDFMLKIINALSNDNKYLVLQYFIKNNYRFYDSFIASYEQNLTDNQKYILVSTYLATDYKKIYETSQTSASTNLSNSLLYTRLNEFSEEYIYIKSDGSIDNEKFDSFAELIGLKNNSSGYGIYAISSSKGILNGEFIPDNIVLDSMKAYYDSNLNLSDSLLSDWRGGTNDDSNSTSDKSSVNYAILVEMKQLIKSISTTIFTLDLLEIDNGDVLNTHYSSESTIDLENHTVTYYVPTGYFNDTSKELVIDRNTLSIANKATIYINNGGALNKVSDDNKTLTINKGENSSIIHVKAEDTTMTADYTIIFIEIDISFDLSYDRNNSSSSVEYSNETITVESSGDRVALKVTSPSEFDNTKNPLPAGMDLKPYLSILSGTDEIPDSFKFVVEEGNHIVADGSCLLIIDILPTLSAGEYIIELNIFDVKDNIILKKKESSACSITSFVYEGKDLSSSFSINSSNVYELTTMIPFGRAFDYDELISRSYLDSIVVSLGATIETNVSKNNLEFITYTVTYTITAENGNTNTYKHYLIEKNPLGNYNSNDILTEDAFNYATVYKDGVFEKTADSINDDNQTVVSFNRGEEPQYRVKYSFVNMYTESDITYKCSPSGEYDGITSQETYAGMTIILSNECNPGNYVYSYTYTSKGIWDNGTYERQYTFPAFVINKKYSLDATIKKLTFYDSYSTLSGLATVINPEISMIPVETSSSIDEVNYFDYINGTSNPLITINSSTKYINYKPGETDYSSNDYNDYFAVGSVSNANLSDYAPTFIIENHAEIYQCTTSAKLFGYGADKNQTDSDYIVLNNHADLFIYVPYKANGNIKIFLIKVENGKWTDVYEDTYGTDENANKITTLTQNKANISFNNIDYTICDFAGKADSAKNISLFMDYIGTPLDNHFWYVSYVVFSEDYLYNNTDGSNTNYKYYHIALIDTSNTIYFELTVNAPSDFNMQTIFITISENIYSTDSEQNIVKTQKQISAYVSTSSNDTESEKIYLLDHNLQVLPRGYFYFYIDLPDGYIATFEITDSKRANQNENSDEEGAYLPPASIVTQKIPVTITITKASSTSNGSWGVSIADIFTRLATEKKNDSTEESNSEAEVSE